MKFIDCPQIGRRAVSEFTISGELSPEPAELGTTAAADWVFRRNSVPQTRTEWWYHTPTRLWFRVRRDTATDEIFAVDAAHG